MLCEPRKLLSPVVSPMVARFERSSERARDDSGGDPGSEVGSELPDGVGWSLCRAGGPGGSPRHVA
eukprot:1292920-Lingulodinium_polyedra.AAC.1